MDGKEHEMMVVKYFTPIENEDEIDDVLQCLKLKWECDEVGQETQAVLRIEPITKLCGLINIVGNDCEVRGVQKEPKWYEKTFHVNRFYFDGEAREITVEDVDWYLQ